MPMIQLTVWGFNHGRQKTWFNTDNICVIRQNQVTDYNKKESVVIIFETGNENSTRLSEYYVDESMDDIMAMVDKPALLISKLKE